MNHEQILNTTAEVFVVCGKQVYSSFNTNNTLNINLSAFEKGVYFLSFNKTVLKFVW
ncbi:MAG: T9SS type A sorting domain-containing protein [Flavobacteriales bacterium]